MTDTVRPPGVRTTPRTRGRSAHHSSYLTCSPRAQREQHPEYSLGSWVVSVTGAGSLSHSSRPVAEIPAELSLFGDPARSIAAVCPAAPSLLALDPSLIVPDVGGMCPRLTGGDHPRWRRLRSDAPRRQCPTETRAETAPARSAAKDLSGCIPWCGRHAERCCTGNLQNFAASAL